MLDIQCTEREKKLRIKNGTSLIGKLMKIHTVWMLLSVALRKQRRQGNLVKKEIQNHQKSQHIAELRVQILNIQRILQLILKKQKNQNSQLKLLRKSLWAKR